MRLIDKVGKRFLAIRIQRKGCINRPFFNIVTVPQHYRIEEEPWEVIGSYDPMLNERNEVLLAVNVERLRYWLGRGAYLTRPVGELLGLVGVMPIHSISLVKAWKARKEMMEAEKPKEEKEEQGS